MKKTITTIITIVIALIVAANAVSFIIGHAPEQKEVIATVVETYDNVVVVETPDGNTYEFYGDRPEENIVVVTICNNEVIDEHSIPGYYSIGEVKALAEEAGVYFIVKDNSLAKLNPADYEDSAVVNCGLIDDIDELGYCFFI